MFSPRLRTILFIVNLAVMLLPLGGLTFLRLYETEMIRQKEGSLHSQGAYLSSMFRRELTDKSKTDVSEIGLPLPDTFDSGLHPYSTNLTETAELRLLETKTRDPHREYLTASHPPERAASDAGETLLPVILRAQNLNLDQVWIVDHFGSVVASSLGEEGRALISWEEVQRALQGESVSLLRRVKPQKKRRSPVDVILGLGEPHLIYVGIPTIIGNRVAGAVIMSGSPSQITQFLYGNKGKLLNAFALLMLVVTLITVLSSLTISEPIQSLIKQTELVRKNDPGGLKPIRWPFLLEIKQLSVSMANMAQTISERSAYITAFARNVSHEFKTPLAGMRGTVELLKDDWREMTDGDRQKFLGNLDRDSRRLSDLVTGLLALARAEVTLPGKNYLSLKNELEKILPEFNSEVVCQLSGAASVQANISVELWATVARNIIYNVINHCPRNTVVNITVETAADGKSRVLFSDNGPGISAANLEKIVSPFFTTARETGGTGLGLSIVDAVLKAHGGELTISSRLNEGTTVQLLFPAV